MTDGNGFDEYRRLILQDLDLARQERKEIRETALKNREAMDKRMAEIQKEIAEIKQSSKAWGGASGGIGGVLVAVIYYLLEYKWKG